MLYAVLHENEIRQVIGVQGEGNRTVDGLATLERPENRCLYFINKEMTPAIREALGARRDCIAITRRAGLAQELDGCLILETDNPRAAIAKVLAFIHAEGRLRAFVDSRTIAPSAVISPLAVVDGAVEIGAGAVVEPFCVIGPEVRIGERSLVRSGTRLYPRVSIGDDSVVGANAVVGCPGFGFVRDPAGDKVRIPHLGGVVIGSDVELGDGAIVHAGTISPTIIADHAKVDIGVLIGHNAQISPGASLVGGSVIGGSSVVGPDAWVGMNATIRNGREIGPRTLVGMDASIQENLAENEVARAPRAQVGPRLDDDSNTIGFTER